MKRRKDIKTTRQKAIWFPESQIKQYLELAEARGITGRTEATTIKNLFAELSIQEAHKFEVGISEDILRFARMRIN